MSSTTSRISPQIEMNTSKINLDEVQKAFFESKGSDFKSWMGAFEKRVNEIYDGDEIVSIDATRENNKLVVTGYIDNKKEPGFQKTTKSCLQSSRPEKWSTTTCLIASRTHDGTTHYEGHRSILDNPFIQMMMFSHMMNMWGGRYHTPYDRFGPLSSQRTAWRSSPQYETQKAANQGFTSRFKSKTLAAVVCKARTPRLRLLIG